MPTNQPSFTAQSGVASNAPGVWTIFQAVFGKLTGGDARPTLWRGPPRPRLGVASNAPDSDILIRYGPGALRLLAPRGRLPCFKIWIKATVDLPEAPESCVQGVRIGLHR